MIKRDCEIESYIRETEPKDVEIFRALCQDDRLELQTVRPVVGNRATSLDLPAISLTYIDANRRPIGWVRIFNINPRNGAAELGYGIVPKARGQGHARPMMMGALDCAFNVRGFNKVYAETASFNLPSVRLLLGLGFKRDGVLRQQHELDGKLFDTHVYSLLKLEWSD